MADRVSCFCRTPIFFSSLVLFYIVASSKQQAAEVGNLCRIGTKGIRTQLGLQRATMRTILVNYKSD